jgi:hypothetical protein
MDKRSHYRPKSRRGIAVEMITERVFDGVAALQRDNEDARSHESAARQCRCPRDLGTRASMGVAVGRSAIRDERSRSGENSQNGRLYLAFYRADRALASNHRQRRRLRRSDRHARGASRRQSRPGGASQRGTQLVDALCDIATASMVETWIDETERRTWFLLESSRRVD